jgi:hypothetical protein
VAASYEEMKPPTKREIAKTVREVLDGKNST